MDKDIYYRALTVDYPDYAEEGRGAWGYGQEKDYLNEEELNEVQCVFLRSKWNEWGGRGW